jgi:hypothetical protein
MASLASRSVQMSANYLNPFAQYLIWAMEGRGKMSNHEIYKRVKIVCKEHQRDLPPNWESEVRQSFRRIALAARNITAMMISLSGMAGGIGLAKLRPPRSTISSRPARHEWARGGSLGANLKPALQGLLGVVEIVFRTTLGNASATWDPISTYEKDSVCQSLTISCAPS